MMQKTKQGFYSFLDGRLNEVFTTSKISRDNEPRTLPCYLNLLNWSGKKLLLNSMVPSLSSLPGECVFNIVTDQDTVSR